MSSRLTGMTFLTRSQAPDKMIAWLPIAFASLLVGSAHAAFWDPPERWKAIKNGTLDDDTSSISRDPDRYGFQYITAFHPMVDANGATAQPTAVYRDPSDLADLAVFNNSGTMPPGRLRSQWRDVDLSVVPEGESFSFSVGIVNITMTASPAICVPWFGVSDRGYRSTPVPIYGQALGACGAYTFPSSTYIDFEDGGLYMDCAWIGGDESARSSELKDVKTIENFEIRDFFEWERIWNATDRLQPALLKDNSNTSYCDLVKTTESTRVIPAKKRDSGADPILSELITTDRKVAISTCENPRSYGPSILSRAEGVLCDMRTRQVHPLCSNGNVPGCYQDKPGSLVPRAYAPLHTNTFKPSSISIDAPKQVLAKRSSADNAGFSDATQTVNNFNYFYREEHQCEDCCIPLAPKAAAEQLNSTHYFGPWTSDPITYRNISGGIYMTYPNNTQAIIMHCPATFMADFLITPRTPIPAAESGSRVRAFSPIGWAWRRIMQVI